MPAFLKRLLLLIAVNVISVKIVVLNAHNLKAVLLTLAAMAIANLAAWKWEF